MNKSQLQEKIIIMVSSLVIFISIGSYIITNYYKDKYRTTLEVGDRVIISSKARGFALYNVCKNIKVIGLRATHDDNIAWVLVKDCPPPDPSEGIFTFIISQRMLIRVNKKGQAI